MTEGKCKFCKIRDIPRGNGINSKTSQSLGLCTKCLYNREARKAVGHLINERNLFDKSNLPLCKICNKRKVSAGKGIESTRIRKLGICTTCNNSNRTKQSNKSPEPSNGLCHVCKKHPLSSGNSSGSKAKRNARMCASCYNKYPEARSKFRVKNNSGKLTVRKAPKVHPMNGISFDKFEEALNTLDKALCHLEILNKDQFVVIEELLERTRAWTIQIRLRHIRILEMVKKTEGKMRESNAETRRLSQQFGIVTDDITNLTGKMEPVSHEKNCGLD